MLVFCALVVSLLTLSSLWAQDFRSTLNGAVTNPAGAAIVAAKVRAINPQTNATISQNDFVGLWPLCFAERNRLCIQVRHLQGSNVVL